MQGLICERSAFVHRAAGYRNPVQERTRREIQELPEQILVHENRRDSVAPDRKLQSAIERN